MLVCPGCRRAEGGRFLLAPLQERSGAWLCPACGRSHPVLDGVPIVLRDLQGWLDQELASVVARPDLPEWLRVGPLERDARLLSAALPCPLRDRVRELVGGLRGQLLDLGCGAGLHADPRVLGLDLNFAAARAFAGKGMVGDAADPPFAPESFDGVLLLNLLDSCRNPRLVLAQADALLKPGGTLLVSCPFAWSEHTPRGQRFTADELSRCLEGSGELGLRLRYRLEPVEEHSWKLRAGERSVHEHLCLLWRAEKLVVASAARHHPDGHDRESSGQGAPAGSTTSKHHQSEPAHGLCKADSEAQTPSQDQLLQGWWRGARGGVLWDRNERQRVRWQRAGTRRRVQRLLASERIHA